MTTPKPDGAGPTEDTIGKAARCWCDPRTSMIEMDVRLATVFAELLAAERAEAEQRIRELEMCIASWKKEELIWKDQELRYRAARTILEEVYKVNYSSGKKQVELDVEVEYQRLKEETSEGCPHRWDVTIDGNNEIISRECFDCHIIETKPEETSEGK